jgi:hypothetical protein
MTLTPQNKLLITLPEGILAVDPSGAESWWALPLAGCRGRALVRPDGSVLALCNGSVVRWDQKALSVVGGGFAGNSHLLRGPDEQAWVYDYADSPEPLTLTRLGDEIGQQDRHPILFLADVWNAVWLRGRRFFLSASGHSAPVNLDITSHVDQSAWIESPVYIPQGVVALNETTVLVAAANGNNLRREIYRLDVRTGKAGQVAILSANSIVDLAISEDGTVWVLADVSGNGRPQPVLLRLTGVDC